MPTLNDYLNLVTSEHRQKPKFIAMISLHVNVAVRIQEVLKSFIPAFDIELAIGSQLDVIGLWVGASRRVAVPITGVYFEWDGDVSVGWDMGVWKDEFSPSSGLTYIPDDIYRRLIKGKIAANSWDGTTEGAYAVFTIAYPDLLIVIQDNQDMTMVIGISGPPLDTLTKALFVQGYIPVKPEGVLVNYAFSTVDAPLFGWDVQSAEIDGWDVGGWAEFL